jgi:hypothetical protein
VWRERLFSMHPKKIHRVRAAARIARLGQSMEMAQPERQTEQRAEPLGPGEGPE